MSTTHTRAFQTERESTSRSKNRFVISCQELVWKHDFLQMLELVKDIISTYIYCLNNNTVRIFWNELLGEDFEVQVPGNSVILVSSKKKIDETTPNCSKPPLRWWELLAFKFWPSHFRAAAVISFFMVEHDGMPRTGVSYSAGCEISETPRFCACPSPKMTGLFLIYKGIPA